MSRRRNYLKYLKLPNQLKMYCMQVFGAMGCMVHDKRDGRTAASPSMTCAQPQHINAGYVAYAPCQACWLAPCCVDAGCVWQPECVSGAGPSADLNWCGMHAGCFALIVWCVADRSTATSTRVTPPSCPTIRSCLPFVTRYVAPSVRGKGTG